MDHCTDLHLVALEQRLCLLSYCRAALARAALPALNRPWSSIAAALSLSAWAGVVLREMRALERAAQCYQAALQLQPNFVQALNNLAVMHTMQASPPERVLPALLFMQLTCNDHVSWLKLPLQPDTRWLRQPDLAWLGLISQCTPSHLAPISCKWIAQGRAKEAMQLLQAAVTAAPGYAEAWNNLGVLQRDMGLVHVRPLITHQTHAMSSPAHHTSNVCSTSIICTACATMQSPEHVLALSCHVVRYVASLCKM